jgi:hypothetical protein
MIGNAKQFCVIPSPWESPSLSRSYATEKWSTTGRRLLSCRTSEYRNRRWHHRTVPGALPPVAGIIWPAGALMPVHWNAGCPPCQLPLHGFPAFACWAYPSLASGCPGSSAAARRGPVGGRTRKRPGSSPAPGGRCTCCPGLAVGTTAARSAVPPLFSGHIGRKAQTILRNLLRSATPKQIRSRCPMCAMPRSRILSACRSTARKPY